MYADLVEEITTTRIEVTRACNLPALGHDDAVAELSALNKLLTADAQEPAGPAAEPLPPARSPAPAAAIGNNRRQSPAPATPPRRRKPAPAAASGDKRRQSPAPATPPRRRKTQQRPASWTRRDSCTPYTCINFPSNLEGYITETQRPSTRRPPAFRYRG